MEELLSRLVWLAQNEVFGKTVLQEIVNKYDPVVKIDQSCALIYPDFVSELLYPINPKFRSVDEFDVRYLGRYLHPGQEGDGYVSSETVFDYLKLNKLVENCFGLRELVAIQARGILFYQEYFKDSFLHGWRDVCISKGQKTVLKVPLLQIREKKVVLGWEIMKGSRLNRFCPALYIK